MSLASHYPVARKIYWNHYIFGDNVVSLCLCKSLGFDLQLQEPEITVSKREVKMVDRLLKRASGFSVIKSFLHRLPLTW